MPASPKASVAALEVPSRTLSELDIFSPHKPSFSHNISQVLRNPGDSIVSAFSSLRMASSSSSSGDKAQSMDASARPVGVN